MSGSKYKGITGAVFAACDRFGANIKKKLRTDPSLDDDFKGSSFLSKSVSSKNLKNAVLRMKTNFARKCEKSLLVNSFVRLSELILLLSARSVGAFFGSFTVSSALIAFLKYTIYDVLPVYSTVVSLVVLLAISLPLLFSDHSLYGLVSSSSSLGSLVGSQYTSDSIRFGKPLAPSGIFFFAGLVLGFLTWFYPPALLPILIFVFILISLIFAYPETSLYVVIALVPFLGLVPAPSIDLAIAVILLILGFTFKLLRGKRALVYSRLSIPFGILLVGVLLSAISPFEGSTEAALMTAAMMLGFVLPLNLVNRQYNMESITSILVSTSAIISFIGIAQYVIGISPHDWLDQDVFEYISGRTTSLFGNPNMLGVYLALSFPFALSFVCSQRGFKYRFLGLLSSVLIICCSVFTWSRSSWVGLFIGFVVFSILMTPRALVLIPAGALLGGSAAFIFRNDFGERLFSLFSLSDHANSYRVSVWNGAVKAFISTFFSGNGAGDAAFKNIYLQFCISGTENAPHSHSIYLQLGISCGIITLAVFILFLAYVIRKSLITCVNAPTHEMRNTLCASVSAVISGMFLGIIDNIFYNYRIMFLFFFITGLACSASNILNRLLVNSKESHRYSGQVSDFIE